MKKKFFLLILLFLIATLSGCTGKEYIPGVKSIKKEDIFNQKEDQYYVLFHRLDCEDCEAAEPYVSQYAAILKQNEKCSGKRKIYSVLLYTREEKPGDKVNIYRKYEGEGQGERGDFYVVGVTDWKDLYIASTASMITISTINGVKTATNVVHGYESIRDSLDRQLGECYLK